MWRQLLAEDFIYPVFILAERAWQQSEQYQCTNAGTAADIMKLAMINMHDYIKGTGKDIHLILQVHDEVIVECPEKILNNLKALEQIMTDVTKLSVP